METSEQITQIDYLTNYESIFTCPVCLENFNDNNIIVVSCCKNKLHLECFMKWIKDNETCPICRNETNICEKIKPLFVNVETEPLLEKVEIHPHESRIITARCVCYTLITFTIVASMLMTFTPSSFEEQTITPPS